MDALSYEQIAEAMETTVPSVKSLLVRARVSLAEAAEARLLTCEQVRIELAEVAEGLRGDPNRSSAATCKRVRAVPTFQGQLNNNRALAAVLPIGRLVLLRKSSIPRTSATPPGPAQAPELGRRRGRTGGGGRRHRGRGMQPR